MLDILILEALWLVSFLFSFWQILFDSSRVLELHLVFALALVITFVAGRFGRKNKRFFWLFLGLIAVMPFIRSLSLRWSLPVIALILWRYYADVSTPQDETDYGDKLLLLFFGMVVLVILRDNTSYFVGETAKLPSYLPLFFLSGIFFLRSLRHKRTGQSQARIRRMNVVYLLLIGITYGLSQFAPIRAALRNVVGGLFSLLLGPIHFVIEKIVSWWFQGELPVETAEAALTGEAEGLSGVGVETALGEAGSGLTILSNVFLALIILFVLWVIYQYYIKRLRFKRPVEISEDIREKLEDIEPRKRQRKRERYPDQPTEQVRYYYRRFLDKFKHQRSLSDTTKDVDELAKQSQLNSTELSEIYRSVRYGEKAADEALVQDMKQAYHKLDERK